MTMNYALMQPLVAIIAGLTILFEPKILNYLIAISLIVIGVMGLLTL